MRRRNERSVQEEKDLKKRKRKLEEATETKNSESPARRARTSRITNTGSRGGWWRKPPDGGEGEKVGGETGQAGGKKIIHQKNKKEEGFQN